MPHTEPRTLGLSSPSTQTSFLIVDLESIPDGKLLQRVKYSGENITPEEAIARAQEEARQTSRNNSDFIPFTFQIPISVCVTRVANDFSLQAISCLDAPLFRTREIVKKFWAGLSYYTKCKIVTFNGRRFDMPLLELAAFRYGLPAREYFQRGRNRFNGDLDLMDWMTNFGACSMTGGLDLLAKLLGKPGKIGISGDQVYELYCKNRLQEINDYCMFDTLDTYFVFLRTRVLTGDITPEQEHSLIEKAKTTLTSQIKELPSLKNYLDHWSDWAME
jgi:predicted PolB exonuclease-like 3'-5' exonuclease